jgi:hypothetical protein
MNGLVCGFMALASGMRMELEFIVVLHFMALLAAKDYAYSGILILPT